MRPPSPRVPAAARRARSAVLGVVAAVVLVACGAGGPAGPGALPPTAGAGGAFPVTVEHAYGSTTVTEAPQRVVALGYSDPDALLAVGVAPVGIVDWFTVPPAGNRWFWQEEGFAGATPEVVGRREEYNLEKIAALQPDLIVAAYSGMTQDQYAELSKITKVVAQPVGHAPFTAPWQVMTEHLATAVGRQARGQELVASVQRRIADVRAAHPQWAGRRAAVASFEAGTYYAFAEGDAKADLLTQLGFTLPPEITSLAARSSNASFSGERIDVLNVDALLWVAPDPAAQAGIEARPEYAALPVAQQGRALYLLTSERRAPIAAAFSYNSVLSLPYVLDQLVPKIDALPVRTP